MKKILSLITAGALLVASAFSFTWSGLVDNSTKVSTSDFENFGFNQSNGIYLSMTTPVNSAGNLKLSAEGLYKYSLNINGDVSTFTNIIDMDLLKLAGKWNSGNGNINLAAGRFLYSDASGAVFSQTSDGLNLGYENSLLKAAVYAGYTGLLNSLNVSMVDAKEGADNTQLYNLCAAYIPLGVDFAYLALAGSNTIGLQGLYFLDPERKMNDKLYGTLYLNGPVSAIGTYSFVTTLGTVDLENKALMLYSKFDFTYYVAQNGILSVGAEYASGSQFGLNPFTTVSARTAANAGGGMPLSGVILPNVTGIFIHNNLFASLSEKFVCAMPEENVTFQGFDTTLSVLYNVLSDVQIGCDIAAFADITSSSLNYCAATLKASLSF